VGLSRRLQADLWIIALSAIWGCTFVVIKRALDDISPMLFIAVRFSIAAALLLFLVPRPARTGPMPAEGRHALRSALPGGLVIGGLLFAGFVFQTIGIQHTTPARSAFITGMYVIFTPLLSMVLGIRRPSVDSFTGAGLAFVGLYLLTSPGGSGGGFGRGELLTVFCAIAFSGHLLAVDHYTRLHDKRTLAFLQVAVVAVLAVAPAAFLETTRFNATPRLFVALGVTAVMATAVAFLILNVVQSWTTPTRAAIIFAAEPVFAALTSWVVEGEILAGAALAGAGLILAGMLTAELGPFRRLRAETVP